MSAPPELGTTWPVGHRYVGANRTYMSMPVGGIGTGTVGFGGRAQFRDWELENHPSKGLSSELTFLACRVMTEGGTPLARVLEGSLFDREARGAEGSVAPMAGLPRFAECEVEVTYPFARALLSDPHFPVRASVEVFNPFSPGDEELSGLPIAVITVTIESLAENVLDCSVLFSVEALVGHALRAEGRPSRPSALARSDAGVKGYLLSDEALATDGEDWGTISAGVIGDDSWVGPSWGLGKWDQGLLAMWQGFLESGEPGAGTFGVGQAAPASSYGSAVAGTVGTRRALAPHGTARSQFMLGWHFPNRRSWVWGRRGPAGAPGPDIVGNFYTENFTDAWDVLRVQAHRLPELRAITEKFVTALWSSNLSRPVKEAASFNLSTLRSQTFFRAADGRPYGWEGCLDEVGSCLGSCTHVWNYDLATGFLFSSLARKMREVEFLHATSDDGAMSFRVLLPLEKASEYGQAAADGQFGCVLKLFREWRLSGDDEWLRRLWTACRRSLEFAWRDGGWDADRDGLAEGAQHNTTDVEYFGPNPVVQSWYLAALVAAEEMARAVGDTEFAGICHEIFASGAASTEAVLFNGRYYQQKVIPPGDFSTIAPGLRHTSMGAQDPLRPEFQVEDGCAIDQVVGDTYARAAGLPPVLVPEHVKSALASIHHLNYVADFGDWTNYMRTYATRGERGHIVLSYPNGLPEHPMPYWSEAWTGVEYVYAVGLVQAGEIELAEDVVAAVRERYSGRRRNPFDEAECGHHYARALSSWGLVLTLTGFDYDARSGVMKFAPVQAENRWFWSSGAAWGTVEQGQGTDDRNFVRLDVLSGSVRVDHIEMGGTSFYPQLPGFLGTGGYDLLAPA
jgi:non-lysosomal glucosylceramidase